MNGLTNVWQLSGNIGRIESRVLSTGTKLVELSIAVSRSYKNKAGEWQKETEWFKAKAFGKLAERMEARMEKGSRVVIAGAARTNEWEDNNGNKRREIYMMVDSFDLLLPFSQLSSSPTSGVTQRHSDEMDKLGDEAKQLVDTFGMEPEGVEDDLPF